MRENIERKQILFLNDDLHKVKMLRIKQNYNGKKIAECKKKKKSAKCSSLYFDKQNASLICLLVGFRQR